jgi:hypothetical protein
MAGALLQIYVTNLAPGVNPGRLRRFTDRKGKSGPEISVRPPGRVRHRAGPDLSGRLRITFVAAKAAAEPVIPCWQLDTQASAAVAATITPAPC